jgi:hypothetical protein
MVESSICYIARSLFSGGGPVCRWKNAYPHAGCGRRLQKLVFGGTMKIIAAIDRPDITEGSFGISHLFTFLHTYSFVDACGMK